MWNTRIVLRVFQVPLKFFVTNYYIFIVCVQSFASAVQSDSVRRPIGFRPPSNRIPFAVQLDSVRCPIGFRSPFGGKCTKKDRASVGVHVLGLYS